MKYIYTVAFLILFSLAQAQIGLNTTTVHPSAQLQLETTNKGFLPPRLNQTQINTISNPAESLMLYNSDLNYIDWFNGQQWINPATKPTSPSINSAIPSINSATIHFDINANLFVTGYEVRVQPGNTIVTGTTSPIVIPNLNENTTYSFSLLAVSALGKGNPSSVVQATTLYSVPGVPGSFDITPSQGAISLSWGASSGIIYNYIVAYKEVGASTWTEISVNQTTHQIQNLTNGATYICKVKAVNNVGSSSYSQILYASPVAHNVMLQDNFNNTSTSQGIWSERENNVVTNNLTTGVILIENGRLKIQGNNGTNDNVNFTFSNTSFGKSTEDLVIQFNLIMPSCATTSLNTFKYGILTSNSSSGDYFRIGKSNASTINRLLNSNASSANLAVSCLDNETLFYRLVFSANGAVTVFINGQVEPTLALPANANTAHQLNNPANVIGFVGIGANPYFVEGITVSGKPIRPSSPNLGSPTALFGNNSAILNFMPPSYTGGASITSYEVISNPVTTTQTFSSFPFTFPGLTNGVSYTFQARAINAFGISDLSLSSNAVVPNNTNIWLLSYPLNTTVLLQWNGVNDATDYTIEYKESLSSNWLLYNDGVSKSPQTTVIGLNNGVNYDFRVKPIAPYATYNYSTNTTATPTATYSSNCWNQIISSGQSLALGTSGSPAFSTTQPFNNKRLNSTKTDFIPWVEGGSETISSSFLNSISQQVGSSNPFNSVLALNAQGATDYQGLKKGTTRYNQNINDARASKVISNTLYQKPYIVRAVTIVHGENDSYNPNYKNDLLEWQADYEMDLKAITGQIEPVKMFTCQMSSWAAYGNSRYSAMSQINAALENPDKIVLVAPKYFLQYADLVHLSNYSYKLLGEYYGKVMKKVIVDKEQWLPLHPTSSTISGKVITINFHVPVAPLQFNTSIVPDRINYGFDYFDDTNSAAIESVALGANGTSVLITLTNLPTGTNKKIGYAYTGYSPSVYSGITNPYAIGGNLCDSDASPMLFPGNYPAVYGTTLRNWCVSSIINVN